MSEKRKILIQLDSDPQPSVFDRVVAIDAGVDELFSYGGVRPEQVAGLVHGAIFTRHPRDLKRTAIFIGGSDVSAGERIVAAALKAMIPAYGLRVSVLLDANGANTTAAAAVRAAARHLKLGETRTLVLGGTGPVGQRVALLLARQGADVRLASRLLPRAAAAAEAITMKVPGAKVQPVAVAGPEDLPAVVADRTLIVAAGAAGVVLLPRSALPACKELRLAIDLNAVPPLGIDGLQVTDKGVERDGVLYYGAIGVGDTKMKLHRAAVAKLFESNDQVMDAEEVYALGEALEMVRVAGTDPGTSSLDVVVLEDGAVVDQQRFAPEQVADAALVVRWLQERGPFDLLAGPSGYGVPLVAARDCTAEHRRLMTLVRPDDREARGVTGFSRLLQALCDSTLPVVFLPSVVHLPTVPFHRKLNRIDLGTADKLCVAALACALCEKSWGDYRACVVELGSAFSACVVVSNGVIVDGLGGTSGPIGWGSGGAWDGELAYLLSPLDKVDLFRGGLSELADSALARAALCEGLVKAVAGLLAVTPCDEIVLSGRLLEREPGLAGAVTESLSRLRPVVRLGSLPGAWVKQAAQGAAVVADGLAGGRWAGLVAHLRLGEAAGTVLDGVIHPRGLVVVKALAGERRALCPPGEAACTAGIKPAARPNPGD